MSRLNSETAHSLLDWAESRARTSDPETSKQAAIDVSLVVLGLRVLFVEAVRKAGPATANEAVATLEGNPHFRESVRKRASECVKRDLVRIVGTRQCKVTGRNASIYEVVES